MTSYRRFQYFPIRGTAPGVAALALGLSVALAQSGVPTVTGNARVDKLLSQMTLAEKLTLIHDGREDPSTYQGQAGYVGGVLRLGIPGFLPGRRG